MSTLASAWPERFRAKVDVRTPEECWEWMASTTNSGYGRYRLPDKHVSAHRFAYEATVGPIPEGLDLDHKCRNRRCVNPAHLEPVTERENTLRGISIAAMNARKTHCWKGHELAGANLYVWQGARACKACRKTNRKRHEARKASA